MYARSMKGHSLSYTAQASPAYHYALTVRWHIPSVYPSTTSMVGPDGHASRAPASCAADSRVRFPLKWNLKLSGCVPGCYFHGGDENRKYIAPRAGFEPTCFAFLASALSITLYILPAVSTLSTDNYAGGSLPEMSVQMTT